MAIFDRIAFMLDGAIRHCGKSKDIYQHTADQFVATFIDKLNQIKAELGKGRALHFGIGYSVDMPDLADPTPRPVTLSVGPDGLLVYADTDRERVEAVIRDSVFLGLNTHYFVGMETSEEAEIIQGSRINFIQDRVWLTLNAI